MMHCILKTLVKTSRHIGQKVELEHKCFPKLKVDVTWEFGKLYKEFPHQIRFPFYKVRLTVTAELPRNAG